jgi:hypothetical protein
MTVAITATEITSVYPSRLTLSVTGLTAGDVVSVYRYLAGVRTAVRGALYVTVDDTAFVAVDAELPFGTSIYYAAEVNYSEVAWTSSTAYTLAGGKVAISDAITGQSAEVVISAWPDKQHDRQLSVMRVGGRSVVVAGERGQFTGQIDVVTETDTARQNLDDLLSSATSGILQIRQPGGYGGIDAYVAVLSDTESRWSQDGTDTRRIWTLTVAQTQAWASELAAHTFTFGDFDDAYTGLTFGDFAADFSGSTFLDFDLTDWSV